MEIVHVDDFESHELAAGGVRDEGHDRGAFQVA
jgi:hypothetical protein